MGAFVRFPCDDQPCTHVVCPVADARGSAWVLVATILGSAMTGIDGTAVNVALPVLERELRTGSDAMQWVIEGYALFLSALILVGGSLGDRFGRRKIFLLGVALFTLASVACGLALSPAQLIGARCVQGIGGALLLPQSLALITASFNERDRGAAIGTWSGFLAITMAIGPLLGGWLVQVASWRFVFFINVPIAAVIVFVTLRWVGESRDEQSPDHIDVWGASLATIALGVLTYGFIDMQSPGRLIPGAVAAAIGVVLLGAFVAVERRSRAPMMPLGIFSSRDFTVANVYTLLLYAGLGAVMFFIPFDLINVHKYPPTAAGAALLPMILIMFVSSRWSGGLIARVGARMPLTVGALLAAAGFVLFARIGTSGSYWATFFPAILTLGLGTSTFVAPLTTTVMNATAPQHAGSASGINNAVSRVAGLLAIAVLGIVLVASTHRALRVNARDLPAPVQGTLARQTLLSGRATTSDIPRELFVRVEQVVAASYTAGFRTAMLICAALALLSGALSFTMLSGRARAREPGGYPEGRVSAPLNTGPRPV